MKKWLFAPPSLDDFIALLRAWRFWTVAALIGGLLGAAFYFITPPAYRARAVVTVDFNMEQAWPDKPDSELFYYLDREARKLVDVAWADDTLQAVSAQTGFGVAQLRSGKLELSQPEDGGWQFYGNDPRPEVAEKLASAWAMAFVEQTRKGINAAVALDAARKALVVTPLDAKLQAAVNDLEAKSLAITPELQISLAQSRDLAVNRQSGLGTYVISGAGLFLALSALLILLVGKPGRA